MSVSTIVNIQKNLGRYGLSTLIVLGNVGNILTILIFIRTLIKKSNSCTCYLLAASITNLILINTSLISTVYGVDHVDPQHTSIVVCKLRWYGGQILLMLSRSFMIAACIDRWALTSPHVKIRSFCRPKIACNVILCLILIWPIIPVHMAIFINNYSGRCGAPSYYAFAFSIYLFIFIGFLPPCLMIFFGVLAWHNLRQIRSRIAPRRNLTQTRFHKADRDLMRMLAGEVLVYVVTTVVYPANVLYGFITTPITQQKSEMRLAIESLVGYIVSPLLNYIYCVAPFYGMI
ncbi:unnamed protein product [Rotaria sordida]|uniref:G-protein coupled receptors family 1 profile domain-containing protein n=1 Tax=Rotaria sordida TaxID=392033 RepID=A0A815AIB7_9BILA|nr:unnamed protein product [Rotaria sordida]CAF1257080.1 unnamed protein product [Rotaria sordida]CAF1394293.1 unnamed protein product [Rotaria sordida]CAF1430585.1 unnamed protein product [Rotaria sordida]CAF1537436.1 unnamed protein product [Rotaria sordida]